MKTIAIEWQRFEEAVVPEGAHKTQRAEQKMTFYAGFMAALAALSDTPVTTSEDEYVRNFEKWFKEGQEFLDDYVKSHR